MGGNLRLSAIGFGILLGKGVMLEKIIFLVLS